MGKLSRMTKTLGTSRAAQSTSHDVVRNVFNTYVLDLLCHPLLVGVRLPFNGIRLQSHHFLNCLHIGNCLLRQRSCLISLQCVLQLLSNARTNSHPIAILPLQRELNATQCYASAALVVPASAAAASHFCSTASNDGFPVHTKMQLPSKSILIKAAL